MNGFDRTIYGGSGSGRQQMLRGWDFLRGAKGFSLLEIMAVLVIMGTMFSITINKFDILSDTASLTALKVGVRELNTRETLVWTKIKMSDNGWSSDASVFSAVDTKIGNEYGWNPAPKPGGGKLHYKAQSIDLNRDASTNKTTGVWH